MSQFIELKDLKNIKSELIFEGQLFKKLIKIIFSHKNEIIANLEISKKLRKNKKITLKKGNDKILLEVTDDLGYDFKIYDTIANELWESQNSTGFISFSNCSYYKSDINKLRLKSKGFDLMISQNKNFIGRIKSKHSLFSNRKHEIDINNNNFLNFMLALCSIEIIQYYIYKLHKTGD